MNKASRKLIDQTNRERRKRGQRASFYGGLIFVSLIVGFTIAKNQRLREEIGRQLQSVLDVTKELISQSRLVVDGIKNINDLLRNETVDKRTPGSGLDRSDNERLPDLPGITEDMSVTIPLAAMEQEILDAYEAFWETMET
jgi:hypothetical protein